MKHSSLLWSQSEKALILVSVLVVALGIGGIHWLEHRDDLPVLAIPTPTMPSPNAFDFFVKAGAAAKDGLKVSYASSVFRPHKPDGPEDHAYSQAEKEQLMRENAPALATLRRGFAYPYRNPASRSFTTVYSYFAKERALARLLTLVSQTKAGRGDWNGAIGSNLDSVQMGVMIPRGGTEIASLVGMLCESMGRRPVWQTYQHLDVGQSRGAAQRLERLAEQQVPFAEAMQEEEWATQASLLKVLRSPYWAQDLGFRSSIVEAQVMMTPKRRFIDNYTNYMTQVIAVSKQPYAAGAKWPAITGDVLNQILCADWREARLKATDNETQDALMMATLALRAYKLDHGAYPVALAALTPQYLKAVPPDPFAVSGPLRYRLTGGGYVLYSVGPDGRDDGGKAIFDPSETGYSSEYRHFVKQGSKGDIVAGVNID